MCGLVFDGVMPPDVTAILHGNVVLCALVNNYRFNARAAVIQCFIGGGFQLYYFAAPVASIGSNHHFRCRVVNAIPQRLSGKTAEYHRMNGANAGAGLHGNDGFRCHGHINNHPVAGFNALGF